MNIGVFQAFLIALFYYFSQSPWFVGLGYWILYRPLVAGTIVGIILGNPVQGAIVGATINLLYLGFISAGGSLPGDPALAGYLGTALALSSGLDVNAALALAVPIGLLGTVIWFGRMTLDSIFVHWADRYAEEGNMRGIVIANVIAPQILLFTISFFPVFFASLYGPQAVKAVLDFLGANILHMLIVIGGMMPALGIALNLRSISGPDTMPFFFLGFLGAVYLKLDVIAIGIFALVIAFYVVKNRRVVSADGN
ncbi:MAG TPA: PTS sugar transporter subunit IIC [Firmicutes bacterium]|uniref:PTS sugar transporter subunit IIC n=1 Tax=Candidatus Fermentithermobacillus carboniphilus TaxID=3085328 RepID=A0AAT9LFD2_9FIRM|nr:MAG: PTS sugar transporter subunit IIC [Candidatus Fermentithermobacillus carboniphilus]HHW17843.1 PTS sugar transporter subunit IIC [Candidatus Fermentithermobacillaceae bacterium]